MKKLILSLAAFAAVVGGHAQLSDRENYDQHIKLGARPIAGDAALQFVIPLSEGVGNQGEFFGNLLTTGDLLTFKYYNTDTDVFRAGIRVKTDNWTNNGTFADSSALVAQTPEAEFRSKSVSRQFNLALGMEKHYSPRNIFDVYAGGEVLFGLGKDKTVNETDFDNGDVDYETRTTNTNNVGFGLVTGFNIFVAELPVSVGLEYGLNGMWTFGGKTKVTREQTIGDTNESAEWFEQESDFNGTADGNQYSKLSRRQFNMDTNQIIRLNIHIYFGTGRE
jgi:hypothetical protein